jgi:dipeptidyl aminopeptidase/acylaminoacyl peptidase
MRRISPWLALLAASALLAGCAGSGTQSGPRQVPQYSIEDFLGTTYMTGASFSPDRSKLLVSTDKTGVYNGYAFPVAGGEPVQLTTSTSNAIFVQSYFPKDERFLYTSDQGGNELDHVYVQDAEGKVRDLTPGKLKADFGGWAYDDRSFWVVSNERDQRFFDVYEYSTDDYARSMFYRDEAGLDFADVSPDRRWIAFSKARTTSDSDVFLYDKQSGKLVNITAHTGDADNQPMQFSPDGKSLYYVSNLDNEFMYLVRYDLASGEKHVVEKPAWDVMFATLSKAGKYMVLGVNNDGRTEVKVYETAEMKPVTLPQVTNAEIAQVRISDDESMLAFYAVGSRSPSDLYVQDLAGGEPKQLTRNLNPKIEQDNLVEAQVVRFKSYDGVEVPGILWKPHQAGPRAKVPALVFVHGGPGGQTRVGYSGLIQYLVNHGYAVYGINNRGSSGYGKSFYQMDDRRHGEADLGDCVASKKMLVESGWVDADRIGILGGSYGGYMVLAALTLQPEEFRVGVDLFGISNWVRTLENIPPWWESFREALYKEMGDPKTDQERLHRISPLFNADKITKPLLVLQGANDPRVLKQESDDIVAAVQKKGVPVEYVVFDDEGHGFINKNNQLKGYKSILDFCDKHLKESAPPS